MGQVTDDGGLISFRRVAITTTTGEAIATATP